MLAIIVSGGEYEPPVRLHEWRIQADFVVAADSGAAHALRMGLKPDLVVGDLDSMPDETRHVISEYGIAVDKHNPDKDETDTELAIQAAYERGADRFVILCPFGGRLDHALANIFLLAMPYLRGQALLAAGSVEAMLVKDEVHLDGSAGDILTLLPFAGDAVGIVTEGLEYPLRAETLHFGYARGVSNVFTGTKATVCLEKGQLLAIHIRLEVKNEA